MTKKAQHDSRICVAGQRVMRRSSVAICGLARDCAGNLASLIPQIDRLANQFQSCRIIVVENDSDDETPQVLSRWRDRSPFVELIQFCYLRSAPQVDLGERPGDAWFGTERMERMTFARNCYLDEAATSPAPDFIFVIDLDIQSFDPAGVANSFGQLDHWDVVTAYGARYSIRNPLSRAVYWDTYAYEPLEGFVDGVQTPRQIRSDQTSLTRRLGQGHLLPARSAFGGLAVYRGSLLAGHRYSVIGNADPKIPVLCDHPTLHRAIRRQHHDLRLMINPSMRVRYGSTLHLARERLRRLTKH